MIRQLVKQIISDVRPVNKVWVINALLNKVKLVDDLWPQDSLDDAFDFIWGTNDVTMALSLLVALGTYATNTRDPFAISTLEKIQQNVSDKNICDTASSYLERL